MNTIDQGLGLRRLTIGFCLFCLADALSYRTIGQQHEFLDELGSVVALLEIGTDRLSVIVDVEVQLLAVELHGTALEAPFTEFLRQTVEGAQLSLPLPLQKEG